jgi:hypothetical protein
MTIQEQSRHKYSVYGLRLDSTRPIPGVPHASAEIPADVFVSLEGIPDRFEVPAADLSTPWYSSPYQSEEFEPSLKVWRLDEGEFLRLHYYDGTQFVVDRSGTIIWAEWPPASTEENTFLYLLGPVLGLVLRLRGIICLHASVVIIDNHALALIGPAGAGKSTTAAALGLRGFTICSDDVAPIVPDGNGFRVEPGYSRLRLWPTSSAMLFGASSHLPRLVDNWDKCYLDLKQPGFSFASTAYPLAGVYFLGPRIDSEQAPFLEHIVPRDALVAFVGNTYVNYLLASHQRAHEFEVLGKLRSAVRLRKVVPHTDPGRLGDLCQLIVNDFRERASI